MSRAIGELLLKAAANGKTVDVQQHLLQLGASSSATATIQAALVAAAARGQLEVVEAILANPRCKHSAFTGAKHREVLVAATRSGHWPVVNCLLSSPGINTAAMGCLALVVSAEAGQGVVVAKLLADDRVDPNGTSGFAETAVFAERRSEVTAAAAAVRAAARGGHTGIVEAILSDSRVDPSADDNFALIWAARTGNVALVDRLLADARVNPRARRSSALEAAADAGHLPVIERLLADPRVDPSAYGHEAFVNAGKAGQVAVVARLLCDPRVDPGAQSSAALRAAAAAGQPSVVRLLLTDPRVDAGACANLALRAAALQCDMGTLSLLLADPRTDPLELNALHMDTMDEVFTPLRHGIKGGGVYLRPIFLPWAVYSAKTYLRPIFDTREPAERDRQEEEDGDDDGDAYDYSQYDAAAELGASTATGAAASTDCSTRGGPQGAGCRFSVNCGRGRRSSSSGDHRPAQCGSGAAETQQRHCWGADLFCYRHAGAVAADAAAD